MGLLQDLHSEICLERKRMTTPEIHNFQILEVLLFGDQLPHILEELNTVLSA